MHLVAELRIRKNFMKVIKNIQEVVRQYKKACILQGQAFIEGNFNKANKYFDNANKCVAFLKEENALNELAPLLYEKDENLRLSTATVLLHIDTKRCLEILDGIAHNSQGFNKINAEMTI